MTKASVFKSSNFEHVEETVKIPDLQEEPEEQTAPEEAADTEADAIAGDGELSEVVGDEQPQEQQEPETETELEPEAEPEPEPLPVYPTAEELQEIYENELLEICKSAGEQAYYDALNRRKAELRECMDSVKELMDQLAAAQQEYIRQYSEELKFMAVDIAEKMIMEKISEDDAILQRLVLQSVSSLKNAEWLNVELSERLVGLVEYIRTELAKPEYKGRATVFPVAGTDDLCRVTTEEGTIVSSIEAQAQNLREAFKEAERQ